jgi:hypothetical protein
MDQQLPQLRSLNAPSSIEPALMAEGFRDDVKHIAEHVSRRRVEHC